MAKAVRRQTARLAYSIERLAKESDISRSMIYEEITAGRLIGDVRKLIVLLWASTASSTRRLSVEIAKNSLFVPNMAFFTTFAAIF